MTGRPELPIGDALLEALRPLVAELVEAELEHWLADLKRRDDDPYLTTAEYAERFKATPGAILARIHRGTLHAIRPPGSREWLIPVDDRGYDAVRYSPRDAGTSGGATPKG